MNQHIFRTAPQNVQQLSALGENFDAHTIGYIQATGIGAGASCLEVGAGDGSIARWLAQRVEPDGQVVATDIDPGFLEALAGQNLPNLVVQRHNIGEDELPEQGFDLIHARLVLIHVPKRQEALARMVKALKPGGWLIIEDFDPVLIQDRAFPAQEADHIALIQKMVTALPQVLAMRGHETGWARKLYNRFGEHGLVNVGLEGHLVVARGASAGAQTLRMIFQHTRAEALAAGLLTEHEIDTFLELLNDPEFSVTLPIMMSAWGQKP